MSDSIFLGTNVVPYIKYVFPNYLYDYLVHVCLYYVNIGRKKIFHASEAISLPTGTFLNSEISFHDSFHAMSHPSILAKTLNFKHSNNQN